ncbi:MAGUK p55 subfamily member 6 [Stylophora pistillata]|uniref:MAGUK p55 subfamily member 6 n=1 Tax=Stylophora pistillata TaxID=50429 RepID=A0A2B4SAJ3_STYPI|nr:MAGUK p55 subfamily member 6 [Stylophora pistillata]
MTIWIILSDRARFGTTIPHTTREPKEGEENGKGYNFTLKILKAPEFMPFVVFIALPPIDTLREIHKRATSEGTITKKQTDEDLQRTAEESEKLFNSYSHNFDKVIVNDSLDNALSQLKDCVEGLSSESQ